MSDTSFLAWPFFDERHRDLAPRLEQWCEAIIHDAPASDEDAACRATVAELGKAGFLKLCVGDAKHRPDVRSLALARETFARHHGLVDFAFAMQGLGSGAISLLSPPAVTSWNSPKVMPSKWLSLRLETEAAPESCWAP